MRNFRDESATTFPTVSPACWTASYGQVLRNPHDPERLRASRRQPDHPVKGSSITKTATLDKATPTGQDLFSHPYMYQWQDNGNPVDGRDVPRDNLFSEPADPGNLAGGGAAQWAPRNPFDAN